MRRNPGESQNRVFLARCIAVAQANPAWSIARVEDEAAKQPPVSLNWKPVDDGSRGSFKYYRQLEIDGRYFWAQANRHGRGGKWISGWQINELQSPGGFFKAMVAMDMLWGNADRAVTEYLKRG